MDRERLAGARPTILDEEAKRATAVRESMARLRELRLAWSMSTTHSSRSRLALARPRPAWMLRFFNRTHIFWPSSSSYPVFFPCYFQKETGFARLVPPPRSLPKPLLGMGKQEGRFVRHFPRVFPGAFWSLQEAIVSEVLLARLSLTPKIPFPAAVWKSWPGRVSNAMPKLGGQAPGFADTSRRRGRVDVRY
jgi:hypothetical protein